MHPPVSQNLFARASESRRRRQATRAQRNNLRFIDRCQKDYEFHIRTVQGCESLLAKQSEICGLLSKHERVAVKACHGVGKTFVAARIVLAFGSSFPGSKIITTAPTGRLVKELLWSEIRSGFEQSRYKLGGEMLSTKWDLGPDWYALGFSPQKGTESVQTPTNFQCFHAPQVLIIFDEATRSEEHTSELQSR